jgi:hypothetical protein
MRKSRLTEAQIVATPGGEVPVAELCRKLEVTERTSTGGVPVRRDGCQRPARVTTTARRESEAEA